MELAGRNVLIIGLGKTGLATLRFLAGRGASCFVTDEKNLSVVERLLDEQNLRAKTAIVAYDVSSLAKVDLVVPSPGVPPSNPLLREAVRRQVPIISELELAYRFLSCPVIAITGTNGKTTTTTLIGNILRKAGKKVFVGGNIGDPLIGFAAGDQDTDYAVVEVSSFQLQWTDYFCPAVAVLLNTLRPRQLSWLLCGVSPDQGEHFCQPDLRAAGHHQRRGTVIPLIGAAVGRPGGVFQFASPR
jgi:UDP-N-acetylmuramoylalanine--D-glutamate ligase